MGNGILCSLCVVGVCKVPTCSPGQPGVACCHRAVAAHMPSTRTCCTWGIAAFDPNVLVLELLPLSSLWSRHTPHPDCVIFSSPSAHLLRIAVTRIHTQTSAHSPWTPPPAHFMAWTLSRLHAFTLPPSALRSPALYALSPLVCVYFCAWGGGGVRG